MSTNRIAQVASIATLSMVWAACGGSSSTTNDTTLDGSAGEAGDAGADVSVADSGLDALSCGNGEQVCAGGCVDTMSAHDNCGTCSHVCGSDEACVSGVCSTVCPSGESACVDGGAATCANLKTDNVNCGSCGMACPSGTMCSNGECSTTCAPNLAMCTSAVAVPIADGGVEAGVDAGAEAGIEAGTEAGPEAGIEAGAEADAEGGSGGGTGVVDAGVVTYCADLQSDNANCGACGKTCPSGQACSAGACTTSCLSPQTLCMPDGGAGYCSDLQTDNANCGVCGTVCPVGQGCSAGQCMPGCFLGGVGTACTANSQCASDSCSGTCQPLGALALNQVDGPYVAADAFYNGTTYTYLAFGANGSTPAIVGGTGVAFVAHGGGGVNSESSFEITSTAPVTSITIATAVRSTFTVHQGSIFFDGTWDPVPARATHTIPTGQSAAWGFGFSEDLGSSNWYASVDGTQTPYTQNVRVHSFSAPISPGTSHVVMGAGYTSGAWGIEAAYWGYSHDLVTCP